MVIEKQSKHAKKSIFEHKKKINKHPGKLNCNNILKVFKFVGDQSGKA